MGLWKYLRNIMLTLVAAFVLWIIFHHAISFYEKVKYLPMGELVEVDGKDMHVYIKGDGDQTIVLLSGLGTAAPVLDYYPLIEELAKDNRVVLVEPFGYGWSDMTNKERSAENIVAELRTALQKMNIEPPSIYFVFLQNAPVFLELLKLRFLNVFVDRAYAKSAEYSNGV
ncbi:MAG TPA: alpha/beta hydrolase [Bacillota bacterium]|nr:alpha/beta hydrolase [Bacillota bacterium]